jgi:transcriptional regulator with XRE-family HTH domain
VTVTAEPTTHFEPTLQLDGDPRADAHEHDAHEGSWGPEADGDNDSADGNATAGSTSGTGESPGGAYISKAYYDTYANGASTNPSRPTSPKPPSPPPSNVRRAELATFLRSRRERLTPEDVGLPGGTRRRTPGLRREEVAQLAGVGVTWYTWLEQGRRINASTQVLDAIARTLRLDRDEHDHLYRLADVPSLTVPDEHAIMLEPEVLDIIAELSSLVTVISERYDLLAWNRSYELVFPSLTTKKYRYRNSMWATFTGPGCCHPFVNRSEEMPHMVATLRAAYGRHVGEPRWEVFIKDLIEQSGEFARMWRDHEVHGHTTRLKIFRHPAVGELRFKATNLGVLATPGARMVVYVPADEDTRSGLGKLEAGAQPGPGILPCGHPIAPVPVV